MKKRITFLVFLISGLFSMMQLSAMDDARLLRYPDINKQLITFVYAGDIWTVSSSGGEAKRLTPLFFAPTAPMLRPKTLL